jgi:hypothetical protein
MGLALDRSPAAAFALLRRELEQIGIKAQARDDADMLADGGKELDCGERAVSDQDNVTVGGFAKPPAWPNRAASSGGGTCLHRSAWRGRAA